MKDKTAGEQSSEYKLVRLALVGLVAVAVASLAAVAVAAPQALEKVAGVVGEVIPWAVGILGSGYAVSRGLAKQGVAKLLLPAALAGALMATGCGMDFGKLAAGGLKMIAGVSQMSGGAKVAIGGSCDTLLALGIINQKGYQECLAASQKAGMLADSGGGTVTTAEGQQVEVVAVAPRALLPSICPTVIKAGAAPIGYHTPTTASAPPGEVLDQAPLTEAGVAPSPAPPK